STLKVGYGSVAVVRVYGAKYKAAKIIAAAQILFPRVGVLGRALAQFLSLEVGQLQPQPLEYSLGDAVLQRQYVAALGVYAVAPEYVACQHIQQLGRDTQLITSAYKPG